MIFGGLGVEDLEDVVPAGTTPVITWALPLPLPRMLVLPGGLEMGWVASKGLADALPLACWVLELVAAIPTYWARASRRAERRMQGL